jgi:hypothetical protein
VSGQPVNFRLSYLIRRGGFFVLLFTVFLTFGWAVLFATAVGELNTTPTTYLIALVGQRPWGVVVLLVTAALGAYGLRHPGMSLKGIGTMVPQIALLFMSAFSALFSAWAGHYPDGTIPASPHQFIGADHLLTVLYAFLYACCAAVYNGGGAWSISRR